MSPSELRVLGDITAESDTESLDRAFFKSKEFTAIRDSRVGGVVVGRRGTGKSALFYTLKGEIEKRKNTVLIAHAPEEEDILPIRAALKDKISSYRIARAAIKLIWKFSIVVEIAEVVAGNYKVRGTPRGEELRNATKIWKQKGETIYSIMCNFINSIAGVNDEAFVGKINELVRLKELVEALRMALKESGCKVEVLIDKIDEGYIPDEIGIGIISGILYGTMELNSQVEDLRVCIFCRDNIYRLIAELDDDFTRAIEGQEIRLNWNEATLFGLVGLRLRELVYEGEGMSDQEAWGRFVSSELRGPAGFKECLRLTLFRPRDVILLLNSAYLEAKRRGLDSIDRACLYENAQSISTNRYNELIKEYANVVPSLKILTSAFSNGQAKLGREQVAGAISSIDETKLNPEVARDLQIFAGDVSAIQILYSVGFLGIFSESKGVFAFCHNGRSIKDKIDDKSLFLIHPCYWKALKLADAELTISGAAGIDDDYGIEIRQISHEERERYIGQLMTRLGQIPVGKVGASQFEEWCLDVIKLGLAGHLSNIQMHPNRSSTSRRDVVGRTLFDQGLAQRLMSDYGCRHLVFEVKNFSDLRIENYRQVQAYMKGEYGRLAFIICRCEDDNLRKGADLEWCKEAYSDTDRKIIIKLPAKMLAKFIGKMRRKTEVDSLCEYLHELLDRYYRVYLGSGYKGTA